MGRCKDCLYFQRFKFENALEPTNYGKCSCSRLKYAMDCDEVTAKELANDLLFYKDAEGYYATIDVGENFGCVHFKEKGE